MCGIVGVRNLRGEPVSVGLLKEMTNSIAYRGPDGEGQYADGPVGLGHRRLAIIDLSASAHQPMGNESGDVVVTYNGEIYNFPQLTVELESKGHQFHSKTDTEVVVHAYEEWGDNFVDRFDGMFAFALWDANRRRMVMARDRYGVKPLYWYCRNGVFICASEIKAILAHPLVSRSVNYPALNEYFTFQNVFSDLTLFDGIRLLPPACLLTLDAESDSPSVRKYWDYPVATTDFALTRSECAEELHRLFQAAVTRQLVSDVPVGSYLSGGMDSGSIVAVAARHIGRLSTFTGGFDLSSASGLELGFDERRNAEVLANWLKTEHYEVVMHAGDMEHVLPQLIWHLEDLRVGQSYPNYYVARLASKFVKVVLSGAGGDELFGGYPWRYYSGLGGASDQFYRNYYHFWQRLVADDEKPSLFNSDTLAHLGDHSSFEVFKSVFDGWKGPIESNEDRVNASLHFELKTFLPGLLLVEDKLSMAHSLETRVPFLDHDLVEFAMRIPAAFKVRGLGVGLPMDENLPGKRLLYDRQSNAGKAVLREAMGFLIPSHVTERSKQGFSAPDATWFRGESIDYINNMFGTSRAMIFEFLSKRYVDQVLDDHSSGRVNRRLLIWSLLSFEWWLRSFFGARSHIPEFGPGLVSAEGGRHANA